MSRLALALGRLAYLAAWLLCAGAAGLWLLEAQGFLKSLVRDRLAERLGALAVDLSIDDVSLDWFEPGLEVRGLTLSGDGQLVRIERVHLELAPLAGRAGLVASAVVDGGRVVLCDELLRAMRAVAADNRRERGERGPSSWRPPRVALRNVALFLRTAAEGQAHGLAIADLSLEPEASGGMALSGRLTPSHTSVAPAAMPIYVSGRETRPGVLSVHASTRELPLALEYLPSAPLLPELPLRDARGSLTFTADAELPFDGSRAPRAHLRASLRESSFLPAPPGLTAPAGAPLAVEDLRVELDFLAEPELGADWLHPDAWELAASAELRLGSSPISAWLSAGRSVGADGIVRAAVRAADLEISRALLETTGLWPSMGETFESLDARGRASVTAGLLLPGWRRPDGRRATDWVLDLRSDGRAGLTYRGELGPDGEREGIPLPIDEVRGRGVYAHNDDIPRRNRLAFTDMHARGSSALVRGEGQLIDRPLMVNPEVDIAFEVEGQAVDDDLRRGLAGLRATRSIFEDYSPQGGVLDSTWRLVKDAEHGGLTASGDARFRGATLAWKELPVPLRRASGDLALRWAQLPTPILLADGSDDIARAFGLSFAIRGELDTAEGAEVRGVFRAETPPGDGLTPIDLARLPEGGVSAVAVEVRRLSLRGTDRDIMGQRFGEAVLLIDSFAPKGHADIAFLGSRPYAGATERYEAVATPVHAEVQADVFKMRTQDLRGRVFVRGYGALDEGPVPGERTGTLELGLSLVGNWVGGVPVACVGRFEAGERGGRGRVSVVGAGLDPANKALLGALAAAVSEAEGEVRGAPDLSAFRVDGRVDFSAELAFDPARADPLDDRYRVHLRNNTLCAGELKLDALEGALEYEGGILQSERITAVLARTPVELSSVRFLDQRRLSALELRDPLLARGDFLPLGEGLLVMAVLRAEDLPIDEDHLKGFIDRESLEAALGRLRWSGQLDVKGATVLISDDGRGNAKVGVHGAVDPLSMSVDLGIPLYVVSGEVEVGGLVFEAGRVRAWLEVRDLYGRLAGRSLERADMTISFVDGRLTVDDLTGELEGGAISSLTEGRGGRALAMDLVEPFGFELSARIGQKRSGRGDADVAGLLGGMFDSSVPDLGRVRGELLLAGTLKAMLGLRGSGWIEIDDARLWSIPVVRELFSSLGFDAKAQFDEMSARFQLDHGVIAMSDMRVSSPLVKLVGSGDLDLSGDLHFHLDVRYGLFDRLPLNRFLYFIQNSLVRVEIQGDMKRPQVFFRNGLSQLVRPHAKAKRQLPLPEFSRPSTRF